MIGSLLKTGMKYGSQFLNPAIGKKIAEEGIKNVPNIYSAGVNRISNKKIKRALESYLANYAVRRFTISKMLNGISNIQTENTIKAIDDQDLSNNFVGVFPSDKMVKFLDYKLLIDQKTGKCR